jgi:hypothetical protein
VKKTTTFLLFVLALMSTSAVWAKQHTLIAPPDCLVANYGQGVHYFKCTGWTLGEQVGKLLDNNPDLTIATIGPQVIYGRADGYWLYLSDQHGYVDVGWGEQVPADLCISQNFGGGVHFFGCTADTFGVALSELLRTNPGVTVSGIGADVFAGDTYGYWIRLATRHGPFEYGPRVPN